tara:strand:+ start:933 stop:1610 length:678 start_codon:yes stop_codon:yes gene_type:complete
MTKRIGSTKILSSSSKALIKGKLIDIDDRAFVSIQLIKNIDFDKTTKIETPVFTSSNGVKGFMTLVKEKKIAITKIACYAIEGKTSKTAKEYGIQIKKTAYSATNLAKEIKKNKETSVIHFTSKFRRKELYEALKKEKIAIEPVLVYNKTNTPSEIQDIDAMLFFSPSQIDSFFSKNNLNINKPVFCIGPSTAKHIKEKGYKNIIIAKVPSEKELIAILIEYYNK